MNKEQAYLSIINATIKTLNECIQRMDSHIRNYSQPIKFLLKKAMNI